MQKYISEEELKTHSKKNDLWISIHGKVYNVTDWVDHHPGGLLPLSYFAGQDVTNPFLAYHPPSSSKYLSQFFTGYHLKDYKVSEISHDYRKLFSKFQGLGLFDKKGHGMLILMLISILMFCMSVYGVLFSKSLWVHLACACMLGFSWRQFGWVMHDSSHYQAMLSRGWNYFAQILFGNCISGLSCAGWKRNHNAHHISTNSSAYDPDTIWAPALVYFSKYLKSYNYQMLNFNLLSRLSIDVGHLFLLLICVFGRPYACARGLFFLIYKKKVPNRSLEIMGMLAFLVWFPLLVSCLPNSFERIAFLAVAFAATGIQHFQFFLNHVACDVYIGPPSANDWVEKQTIGSLNIACSPWMDWFHGGLQFQIEHHLFPRMPRCQLRTIAPFVKEMCKKHELTYNCATSFWEATRLTLNTVSSVSNKARNSSDPKNVMLRTL